MEGAILFNGFEGIPGDKTEFFVPIAFGNIESDAVFVRFVNSITKSDGVEKLLRDFLSFLPLLCEKTSNKFIGGGRMINDLYSSNILLPAFNSL